MASEEQDAEATHGAAQAGEAAPTAAAQTGMAAAVGAGAARSPE